MRLHRSLLPLTLLALLLTAVLPHAEARAQARKNAPKLRHADRVSEQDTRLAPWRNSYGTYRTAEALRESYRKRAAMAVTDADGVTALKTGRTLAHGMHSAPRPTPQNQYDYAALAIAANGDLVMAYKDWGVFPNFWDGPPTDPAKIYVVRSSDGGENWSEPLRIAEGDFPLDFNFLEMTRLGSGRLLLNDLVPFEDDHYFYSDDNGQTWTPADLEPLWNPSWHGPIDGQVWYTHTTDQGNGDLVVRTSADGVSWSADQLLYANPDRSRYRVSAAAIAPAGGSSVAAVIEVWDDQQFILTNFVIRSSDGGSTWSGLQSIPSGGLDYNVSALEQAPDGTLWMTLQGFPPNGTSPFDYRSDVYYLTSSNGGATWSSPTRFTTYLGDDYLADIAFTAAGPVIAFSSPRDAPGGVYYGLAGTTVDAPPPAVQPWYIPWGGLGVGETDSYVVAAASDAGIASVTFVQTLNGTESSVAMTNGGPVCAEFNLPNAYCWHAALGPFAFGDEIFVRAEAVDQNGLTASGFQEPVFVQAMHNVGNVEMPVGDGGRIQEIVWPAGGHSYASWGGAWAGANGTAITEDFWSRTSGFTGSMGAGESDQDIVIAYDDGGFVLGIDVIQRTYQWSEEALQDGIVFEYEYTNTGAVGDFAEFFAGMHLDADLVDYDLFWDDRIGYSSTTDIDVLYMYDSKLLCGQAGAFCPDGYIGLAVLRDASGSTGSTLEPYTATWNFWNKDPYLVLTEGFNAQIPGRRTVDDYRMVIAAQPFALPAGASQKVAFALVMGSGAVDMLDNVRAIAAAYDARVTSIEHDVAADLPADYTLEQNYPNPFNPATTFTFALPRATPATLTVHDLLGREVATLASGTLEAGTHTVRWDASGVASGMYLYRLSAGDFTQVRTMMLIK